MGSDTKKPGSVTITLQMAFDAQMLEHMDELSFQCGLDTRVNYLNAAHRFFSFHIEQNRQGNRSALLILPSREVHTLDFTPLEFARKNPNRAY